MISLSNVATWWDWFRSKDIVSQSTSPQVQLELLENRIVPSTVSLLKDINPDTTISLVSYLTNVDETVFFSANDGATGKELWKSDGTLSGTQLVSDINPSYLNSSPFQLTNVNGTLFFTANDGVRGEELWLSDGTAAGTQLVKDINLEFPGSTPNQLVNVSGTLYFTANDGVHGTELWKTDGTYQGTQLVKDINPNEENSDPVELVNVNGTLFFSANNATYGEELWRSDGTAAGTQRVRNINPGSEDSWPRGLTNLNGTLFFRANDGTHGNELWMSDGSYVGTQLVRDINPNEADSHPFALTNVNGTLFFAANDGTNGFELWKSDGSDSGTQLVRDINPYVADASPFSLTNVNGTLFFAAIDGTNGFELWTSNGTAVGTRLVKNVNPSEAGSNPRALTNVNGTLFFSADDGTTGMELWQSDGTAEGTRLARDINPGGANSYPLSLVNVNGSLLFVASDGVRGAELWKAEAGVKRLAVGADAGSAPRVQVFDANGNPLFDFLAYDAGFTSGVRVAIGDFNQDGVDDIITSPGAGGGPEIRIFDGVSGAKIQSFFAYDTAFRGGAYVATGDFNADGIVDIITGAGVGGGPDVRVFSGTDLSLLDQFFAYDIGFTGGVRLAVGDVNGDGAQDIVTAAGTGGGPHVKVFDRQTQTEFRSFFAYDTGFLGGVFVAVGDVDDNGIADIITGAGTGGGPDVRVFRSSDLTIVDQFFAYDINFSGGVRVALGDINGDGVADIVTAPGTGGSNVKVFDGLTRDEVLSFSASDGALFNGGYVATSELAGHVQSDLWKTGTGTERLAIGTDPGASPRVQVFDADGNALFEFFAYDIGFTGGVRVAVGDVNRDGVEDIITAPGAGGGPEIRFFDGTSGAQIQSFFAYDMEFRGGAYVATRDVNADGIVEIITGAGPGGGAHVRVFSGADLSILDEFFAYDGTYTGGVRVAIDDVNGDGVGDILTAPGSEGGLSGKAFDGRTRAELPTFLVHDNTFTSGVFVASGELGASIRSGSRKNRAPGNRLAIGAEVGTSPLVQVFDTFGTPLFEFLAYDPGFTGGVRVTTGDINGDRIDDIITAPGAGGRPEIRIFDGTDGTLIHSFFAFAPEFSGGVQVATGNLDDDALADIVVGADSGGGPHVRIYAGSDLSILGDFFAYETDYTGGVRVAVDDTNADGFDDVVTAPNAGGGQSVKVFDGKTRAEFFSFVAHEINSKPLEAIEPSSFQESIADVRRIAVGTDAGGSPLVQVFDTFGNPLFEFFAYDALFTGGVRVAVDDINGDFVDDVITSPGVGHGPEIRIFDGKTGALFQSFFAFDPTFLGGVYVTTGDVNGDGSTDIITGIGEGASPQVRVFSGNDLTILNDFLAYEAGFTGGVRVAIGDLDGDLNDDIITSPGAGRGAEIRIFNGTTGVEMLSFSAYETEFLGGVYATTGDVNGDGRTDIITGIGVGNAPRVRIFNGTDLSLLNEFLAFEGGFTGGVRVASGDVNGDGFADVLVAPGGGGTSQVQIFDVHASRTLTSISPLDAGSTRGLFVAVGNGSHFSRNPISAADEELSDLDRALKEQILAEIPELLDDSVSDWIKVNKLREWAYSHIDVPSGPRAAELIIDSSELSNLSAGAIFQLFADNVGGVYCGGAAVSLCSLYQLFGYRCYSVGAGLNDIAATHAFTLVEIRYGSETILVHQDAYLNIGYVDEKGDPLDHFDMLYRIRQRQNTVFAVGNDNVETPDMLITARSVQEARDSVQASWMIDPEDPTLDNPQFEREGVYSVKSDRFLARLNERWAVIPTIQKVANRSGYLADASYLYALPYYVTASDLSAAKEFLHRDTQFLSSTDSFPVVSEYFVSSPDFVRTVSAGATTYLDSTDVLYF